MKKRIFKYYFILIFIILLASIFFTTQIAQNYYKDEVENKLQSIAFSLEYYLLEDETGSGIDYHRLANDYAGKHNAGNKSTEERLRITFIDFTGKVLGDSEADFRDMENHINREEIQEAIAGDVGSSTRYSKTIDKDFLYVATPLSQQQVVVRVSVPLVQLNKINDMIRFYSLLTFFGALMLTALISQRITASITKSLNDLMQASKEIANGSYTKKIKVNTKDELGQLALNFNEMAAKLEHTITALHNKKIEVESIVDSMTKGLVAVDNDFKIILINPAAIRFFSLNENPGIVGDKIAYHIRNNRINTLLKDTIESGKSLKGDITIGEKILHINTSPIRPKNSGGPNSGGIVYIEDITKVRKLEQLRTEFVSNVTHELKTPITSIRGFIETLKNGAIHNEQVAGRFLDIIDIEAERLHGLIEDILQLSEIETKQKDTELENFSLSALAEEVFAVLQPLAMEKDISLYYSAKEEVFITANKNRIKQLIMNLVDNGIKYNVPCGSVTMNAFRDKSKIVISVKDTGIGIPAEYCPRIFERFFRVDKGRDRDMGGTGLGLSIVKHIVNLYNGNIKVNTEIDKGTEFIIEIPS